MGDFSLDFTPFPPFQPNQEYNIDFFKMPPGTKILVVKNLVEWVLCDTEDLALCIEADRSRKKEFNFKPLAYDSQDNSYWYLDEGISFLAIKTAN